MYESNPALQVGGVFAVALCCFAMGANWMYKRWLAADARSICTIDDEKCGDWVLARYGYFVEGHPSLTRSQKLEVIRRKLCFETNGNTEMTQSIAVVVVVAAGLAAFALL